MAGMLNIFVYTFNLQNQAFIFLPQNNADINIYDKKHLNLYCLISCLSTSNFLIHKMYHMLLCNVWYSIACGLHIYKQLYCGLLYN